MRSRRLTTDSLFELRITCVPYLQTTFPATDESKRNRTEQKDSVLSVMITGFCGNQVRSESGAMNKSPPKLHFALRLHIRTNLD